MHYPINFVLLKLVSAVAIGLLRVIPNLEPLQNDTNNALFCGSSKKLGHLFRDEHFANTLMNPENGL